MIIFKVDIRQRNLDYFSSTKKLPLHGASYMYESYSLEVIFCQQYL